MKGVLAEVFAVNAIVLFLYYIKCFAIWNGLSWLDEERGYEVLCITCRLYETLREVLVKLFVEIFDT